MVILGFHTSNLGEQDAKESMSSVFETFSQLRTFKREIRLQLGAVPFVEAETPVLCAWYPTMRAWSSSGT
jgi:hypothetical protein